MRPLAVLLVALLAVHCARLAAADPLHTVPRAIPTPLLAWSGRALLASKQVFSSLSSDSLFTALDALVGKPVHSPLINAASSPEVVLICAVQVRYAGPALPPSSAAHFAPRVRSVQLW